MPRRFPPKKKVAESHRCDKDYEFDAASFASAFLPLPDPLPSRGTLPKGVSEANLLAAHLSKWMRDMKAWGEDVRDDILRLEAATGAALGDPGDPPPAPRGK